jgi:hypothetical protein
MLCNIFLLVPVLLMVAMKDVFEGWVGVQETQVNSAALSAVVRKS